MFSRKDPVFDAFLDYVDKTKGYVADIGTAFGYASLEALKRGGRVLSIDLAQDHLDALKESCPAHLAQNLETVCGHFPNTVSLPENTFDAIFLARLLIFLTPDEIDVALKVAYKALKPGGSIFILSPSPFREEWKALFPIYTAQKERGSPWPGHIDNLWTLLPDEQERLPNTIQLIDPDSLRQALMRLGFTIQQCEAYPEVSTSTEQRHSLSCAIAFK